jgi:putative hydrolase of HD superfamily
MLDFLHAVGALKNLPRQGWLDRRISEPESVADHIYRVTMMAWALGSAAGLDTQRLVKLALVHDLPEAIAGDATPYLDIVSGGTEVDRAVATWREVMTPEELAAARHRKYEAEADGLAQLCGTLPPALADELTELWEEYAERRSPEARFAAEVDKLEALLQAIEYRDAGEPADVENFLQSAREAVEHPVLRALLAELEAQFHSDGDARRDASSFR